MMMAHGDHDKILAVSPEFHRNYPNFAVSLLSVETTVKLPPKKSQNWLCK